MYLSRIFRPSWLSHEGAAPANLPSLTVVIVMHVATFWALTRAASTLPAVIAPAPILVSLLAAEPVADTVHAPTQKSVAPKSAPTAIAPIRPAAESAALPAAPVATSSPAVMPADAAAAAPPSPAASANVAAAIVPAIAPVTPPHANAAYLENPPPAYPPLSRRLGEQGRVMLRVHVSADGNADAIELKSKIGRAHV